MLDLKTGSAWILVMAAFAGKASAMGIGILKVDSHLGEPFRASVKIVASPDETVDASCISLDPSASDNGIFQLGSARLGVVASDGGRIVRIATDQKINEPIVTIKLRVNCGNQGAIEKAFTVFLDPPTTSPEVPEAAAPIGKALPEKPPVAKARAARTSVEQFTGNLFRIKPNDTLSGIAHDFFPNSTMAQRRFMAAVLRENPELSPNHLEAGSQIRIPDIGPKGPLAKQAKPAPKASAEKKAAAVPAAKAPAKPAFHLDIVSSVPKSQTRPDNPAEELKRTETQQLIARADDQTVHMLQLQGQVKTLEDKLAELQSRIAVADRLLARINAAKVQPPPPPAAFPKWAWAAAALLALLAAAAGIFRYLQTRQAAERSLRMDHYFDPKPARSSLIDPLDYFESDSPGER